MKKYIFSFVFLCLMALAGAASVQAQTIMPGNNFQTAVVFSMNTTQQYQIDVKGAEKWLKFESVAGASYLIQTKAVGLKGNVKIQLYNSDGKATLGGLEYGGDSKNEWKGKSYYSALGGTRYIRITGNSFGSDTSFSLRVLDGVGVVGGGDDFEPDGLPLVNAKSIPLNTEQSRNFHASKDEDWVKIDASACATYLIQTKAVGASGSTKIELYEADGKKSVRGFDYGGKADTGEWQGRSFYIGVAGPKYLKITSNFYGPSSAYLVRVTDGHGVAGGGDDYEYDGCKVAAKPIQINTEQTHNMHAGKDEDWLTFEAVAGTSYQVQTKAVGPAGSMKFELYEADGKKSIGGFAYGGSTKDYDGAGSYAWKGKTYVMKTSGTKYIKVTSNDSGPSTTYLVRVALPNVPTTPTAPAKPTAPTTTYSKTWQPITTGGQNNDGKYWGPAYCNNHAGSVMWPEHPTSTYNGPKIEKCYNKNGQAVGKMLGEMTDSDRNLTGQDCSAYPTGLEIKTKVDIGYNYRCTAQTQSAKRGMMAATLEAVRAIFRKLSGSQGE